MSSRLQREREFHNAAFAEHSRSPASKFYEVERAPLERYGQLLDLPDLSRKRVLEYGCGPGSHAFLLARRGAQVTGIDISDVAIAQATERAKAEGVAENCSFEVMNAERTVFEDGSFDLICGTAILHHLDLDAAYAEIARLLAPSGRAAFVEPLGHNPAINAYRRRTPDMRTDDEHPLLVGDLELARSHFTEVEIAYFNLLTLLAVPFRRTALFERLVAALGAGDRALFRIPAARRHAWMVVISLTRPLPAQPADEAAAPTS